MSAFIKNLLVFLALAASVATPIVYSHTTFATDKRVDKIEQSQDQIRAEIRDDIKTIQSDIKQILRNTR